MVYATDRFTRFHAKLRYILLSTLHRCIIADSHGTLSFPHVQYSICAILLNFYFICIFIIVICFSHATATFPACYVLLFCFFHRFAKINNNIFSCIFRVIEHSGDVLFEYQILRHFSTTFFCDLLSLVNRYNCYIRSI